MFKKIVITLFFCIVLIVIYAFANASTDLEQAKSNIISLIQEGNYAEAQVQTQKILSDFSEHEDIAKTAWQIAKKYDELKEYDKAFELNQYNIEHFSNDANAVLSQVEIVKFHFRKGDNAAVDASVDNFLTVFSGQPALPKGIYHIARRYDEFKRYDKAIELHQYNVEHFPDDINALWSQVEIIHFHLRNKDDAAVDAAVNNLLTVFPEQPSLSKEIYHIARKYDELERYDKAIELHQYNVEHFPDDINALWSQVEIAFYHIGNGDDAAADTAVDNLFTVFSEQPTLSKEIYHIARKYDELKKYEKAIELHQYNVEHFPNDIQALWSQVETVFYYIHEGNDVAADSAFNKLLSVFSGQPTLPKEMYLIADRFSLTENRERAVEIYQSLIDRGAVTDDIDSQVYSVMSYFALGDNETAQEQLDKLIADFNDYPDLPKVLSEQIAQGIYGKAMSLRAKYGLDANSINEFHKAISILSKIADDLPISQYTPQAYYGRAVILSQELRQHADGIELFEYLVSNWPDYEFAYSAQYQIGKYYDIMFRDPNTPYEQRGKAYEKREQGYIGLIEKYPDCELVKRSAYNLGGIHYKNKDWELAAAYYKIALQKSYETNEYSAIGKITYRLGQAYQNLGQSDDAKQVYQQYLNIAEPNDPITDKIKIELQNIHGGL